MSKKFSVSTSLYDPESSPFDRQQRIDWWDQDRINSARVMIVGAGAIGNETLKNLALLGVQNVFIVDFDEVSLSNLSRTVLFKREDIGKRKAEMAAQRFKELCLGSNPKVDWLHGDLVWEIGPAIYHQMDVVLGCLDNVETRFSVNRNCWIANVPWIDAGISELALHVTPYLPRQAPCYECQSPEQAKKAARERYSCDAFKRASVSQGKVPTVQIASAIASAIQVQEAMKIICNQEIKKGHKIFYHGKSHYFDTIPLVVNPDCDAHIEYDEIIELPLSSNSSLRHFLQCLKSPPYSVDQPHLDFSGDLPELVVSATCKGGCGKNLVFLRPAFRILDTEVVCEDCRKQSDLTLHSSELTTQHVFSLDDENVLLDMTLHDLGIPYGHIVAVYDSQNTYRYFSLMGDISLILPNQGISLPISFSEK